jgi:hypothetical protein
VVFDKKSGDSHRQLRRELRASESFDVLLHMQIALRASWSPPPCPHASGSVSTVRARA